MTEDGLNSQNSETKPLDQTHDDIIPVPELPEEPHDISLLEVAKPKPIPKAIPTQIPIKTTKTHDQLEPLPQTRADTIKPLIPEPHKIARTPEEDLFAPHAGAPKTEVPEKKLSKLQVILIYTGLAIGSVIFVYVFLNFPAIWSKVSYRLFGINKDLKETEIVGAVETNEDLLFLNTVYNYPPKKYIPTDLTEVVNYDNATELFSSSNFGYNEISDNEMIINKLGIRTPIVWDVPTDDATLMDNLKHGVVHYNGTSKPGELAQDGKGNIFIAGHSSYYWWDDGNYKTVFANLDGLTNGDEIVIKYKDYYFLYKVIDKKVVNPSDVGVLAQNTDKPVLTLMTCVPVGTDAQRLIVTSELVGVGKVGN